MTIDERKEKFLILGKFLGQFGFSEFKKEADLPCNDPYFEEFKEKIDAAVHYNGWFTKENVIFSVQQWASALTEANLEKWLTSYSFKDENPKQIAIIMAGNIPLVGFHDFVSVLLSGNKVLVKLSSNDEVLLPVLANYLICIAPEFKDYINFTSEKIQDFDAVIATGSNNTARYFEYYFANKPSIIRKNRNSVAILTGNESEEELKELGEDIFRYYGLGCRNVSKLYVPKDYNFTPFFEAIYDWNHLLNHNKYINNYDYNKAVYLMSLFKLVENGFLILKEDASFGSPIGSLFFEYYTDLNELKKEIQQQKENIQCVVSKGIFENEIDFGATQKPKLWDYADGVDTMEFLNNL